MHGQHAAHPDHMSSTGSSSHSQRFVIGSFDESVIEHVRVRQRHGRSAPRFRGRVSLNMTAMIDIVFLLLVYFIVATDFRLGEEVYRMDLPSREGVSQADPFKLDDEPLRIHVASTGLGPDMYRLFIDGPYAQLATFNELFDFLRSKQVNEFTTAGLFEPTHPIVIQPTATTRWDHTIEALNAAVRAGYSNVTFAKPG